MIGNKYDLMQDIEPESIDSFAEINDIKLHFKVSAKENKDVEQTFESIARYLHSGLCEVDESTWDEIHLDEECLIRAKRRANCVGSCSRS